MGAKRQSVSSPRTYAVLCVDDHAPGLNIRKIFLESFGYRVQTAASGAAALELAAQHPFDVVVLDYRMPEMTGLELARELKGRFPALPLIVLSGYAAELPLELRSLISGYVAKGSHPEVLLQKLAEVLGGPAPHRRSMETPAAELIARNRQHLEVSKQHVKRAEEVSSRNPKRRSRNGRRSA